MAGDGRPLVGAVVRLEGNRFVAPVCQYVSMAITAGSSPQADDNAPVGRATAQQDFRRLWLAQGLSFAGSGMTLAAGPLLMTTLTSNPLLIGGAAGAQQLPVLLFGLFGGALVDRREARRLIVSTDLVRGLLMVLLSVGVFAGVVAGGRGVVAVYATVFLLGMGECIVRPAGLALLPSIVAPDRLAGANARLHTTFIVGGNLVAPPAGALLFSLARPLPFAADAVSFVVGSLLLLRLAARGAPAAASTGSFRRDVTVGLRWLMNHPRLRILALCMLVMNITLGGVIATLVIYAQRRLHITGPGYGLLLACVAAGSIGGSLVAGRLRRVVGPGRLLAIGLVVETSTHLGLALVTVPLAAAAVLVVFGVHDGIWGVVTTTARQQLIPEDMRGRVQAAYLTFSVGGHAVGGFLGGALVALGGPTGPLWFAFGVMSLLCLVAVPVVWRSDWPRD